MFVGFQVAVKLKNSFFSVNTRGGSLCTKTDKPETAWFVALINNYFRASRNQNSFGEDITPQFYFQHQYGTITTHLRIAACFFFFTSICVVLKPVVSCACRPCFLSRHCLFFSWFYVPFQLSPTGWHRRGTSCCSWNAKPKWSREKRDHLHEWPSPWLTMEWRN